MNGIQTGIIANRAAVSMKDSPLTLGASFAGNMTGMQSEATSNSAGRIFGLQLSSTPHPD